MSDQGKLFIFSAPSGAGKTTIVRALLDRLNFLEFSISATSRPMRRGEKDGVDYYFISPETFRNRIDNNEFVEWEEVYSGSYYGTLKSEMERIWSQGKHVVFDVDVAGGVNLKKQFGDRALSTFVMPPSLEVLAKRLIGRKTETDESLKKRLEKAEFEIGFAKDFDVVLVNDQLEKSIEEACNMVKSFIGCCSCNCS
jgi:guanylate kinase